MAEHFERLPKERISKEETNLLVCEVQLLQVRIYGTPGMLPNANYVKTA